MQERQNRDERGFALITALGFLLLFAMLGAVYLGAASNAVANTRVNAWRLHAQTGSEAAIQAAIAELQTAENMYALREMVPGKLTFEIASYEPPPNWPAVDDLTHVAAEVTIEDESAKLNINHAPPSVLRGVLDVVPDANQTARTISQKAGAEGQANWYASVDDLEKRGILTPKEFQRLDTDLLTVLTVPDPAHASAFLNLNSADPKILAAVLDISPQQAEAVVNARPFNSVSDLVRAAQKGPETYNYRPAPGAAPGTLAAELSLAPTCFRLHCRAAYEHQVKGTLAVAETEAVVAFGAQGEPVVMYWTASPGEASQE